MPRARLAPTPDTGFGRDPKAGRGVADFTVERKAPGVSPWRLGTGKLGAGDTEIGQGSVWLSLVAPELAAGTEIWEAVSY